MQGPTIRRVLPLLPLLALALWSCGTGVHEHAIEVAVNDPSGRLGAPPHEVSVFDWRMGRSEEWARKTMGSSSGPAPFRTTYSTVDTVTIGTARPDKVELAIYLPRLERLGFFVLRLEPKARPAGEAAASFAPWGDYFPAEKAPTLAVKYEAAPAPKGWRIVLRLDVRPRE